MAFQFAYALNGDGTGVVKDYPLDTVGNYGATPKKGDLVFLSAGKLRKVVAATPSGSAIGNLEGQEFLGLVAQGQPYAATNSSFIANATDATKNPNGVGKVRQDKTASVYKVNAKAATTIGAANIGVAYGIAVDGNGDQSIDTANTTTTHVRVIDYTPDGLYAFVTLV